MSSILKITRLYMLFIIAFSSTPKFGNCKRITGIYVDNELDQTMVHRVSSRREKRDITRNILNFLDLPTKSRHVFDESLHVKRSATRYIYDVYRNELNKGHAENYNFRRENLGTFGESDIIMTYAAHINSSKKNDFWFDVSETPNIDNVIGAELQLYPNTYSSTFKITVYNLVRSEENGSRLRFIDSVNVTTEHEGWIKLNVIDALRDQLNSPNLNQRLHLSIVVTKNDLRKMDAFSYLNSDEPERQPFLVGYFAASETINRQSSGIRRKRNDLLSSRSYLNNPYVVRAGASRRRVSSGSAACRLHALHVRFSELEFDNLIVAPEGYDAQYCAGECRFPLNAHVNATNHAIVQTLVHFLQPGRVPEACCAPRDLDHLSVLYSRDGVNHVLKRYKNMIIKSCGCH